MHEFRCTRSHRLRADSIQGVLSISLLTQSCFPLKGTHRARHPFARASNKVCRSMRVHAGDIQGPPARDKHCDDGIETEPLSLQGNGVGTEQRSGTKQAEERETSGGLRR
jgi:hypothetical protein